MNKKSTALLLSALVLPGLGQLYLGRKMAGGIIIVLVNLVLLLALFVLLRGLSPVIASKIAGGAISISPSEVMRLLMGQPVLAKRCLQRFSCCGHFQSSISSDLEKNSRLLSVPILTNGVIL